MEYLIFAIILIPCGLLLLFVVALATGAIHDQGELELAARGLRHSWDSMLHRR